MSTNVFMIFAEDELVNEFSFQVSTDNIDIFPSLK